jgi:hypothetical protein
MSYIGVSPSTAAFPFDQFSGNGTTTAFTMSYAPASTTSMVVCISGVVQNPNTYGISGLTLTFSQAPPTGTNNIAVLYLGIPATSVTTPGNTAFFSSTSFTATAGQTTFTPSGSYQVGFLNVIRNGSQLAPADYTATNGTTVVLANACVAGDIVVIEVYNLTSLTNALPSTGGTVTGATTFNSTVSINGANGSGYTGYKNRIINGGMVIDQRNNGASVTQNTGISYTVDRFLIVGSVTSKFTAQRNAGAVTPPTGFTNYLGITSSSAYSVLTSDFFLIQQPIEGLNVSDLAWGTASAATITVSFWVRSSLTGTFGGAIRNAAANRSYPFSYTISSANTWEQKSVTIAGDTTGTWPTDNTQGMSLTFGLGMGSTFSGTANAWQAGNFASPTGATSVVGTNGATFYITGVQLERGSNATSFEFRDYGRELIMCQRYYWRNTAGGIFTSFGFSTSRGSANSEFFVQFPVTMRAAPTSFDYASLLVASYAGSPTAVVSTATISAANTSLSSSAVSFVAASSIGSGGQALQVVANNSSSAYIGFNAEL